MASEHITVGTKLPEYTFSIKESKDEGPVKVGSEDLWGPSSGKVIIFGLPGAFTPTCSAKHLPGFVEDYDKLKQKGAAAIYCLSTNDPYVMYHWSEAHNAAG